MSNAAMLWDQEAPFDAMSAIDWFRYRLGNVFQPASIKTITGESSSGIPFGIWDTVNILCKSYSITDFIKVIGYLRSNFELVPLLFSLVSHLEPLGLPYIPELKLVEDDGAPESSVMFITIPVDMNAVAAVALLDQMDSDWWLDLAACANGHLVLDVRHI